MKNNLSIAIILFPVLLFLILYFFYPGVSDTVFGISFQNYKEQKALNDSKREDYINSKPKKSETVVEQAEVEEPGHSGSEDAVITNDHAGNDEAGAKTTEEKGESLLDKLNRIVNKEKEAVQKDYEATSEAVKKATKSSSEKLKDIKNSIIDGSRKITVTEEQKKSAEEFLKKYNI